MIYAGKSVIINQEMKDCVSSVQIIKSQKSEFLHSLEYHFNFKDDRTE